MRGAVLLLLAAVLPISLALVFAARLAGAMAGVAQ